MSVTQGLEDKFKEFQIKLLEEVQKKDLNAYVTYSQSPEYNGVLVAIHSSTGVDEFLVDPIGVAFVRLFR